MKKIPIIITLLFSVLIFAGAAKAQPKTLPSDQTDKVYKMSEVDEKPVMTKKPRGSARTRDNRYGCPTGTEGTARVRLVLRRSGMVTDVEMVKSSGCAIFDDNVIEAAKKIQFTPGKKNGEAVSVSVVLIYSYFTTG